MTTHVLNKSVGPWSAGTAIDIVGNNHDGTYTVEIVGIQPDEKKGIDYEDLLFDIESEYITELRPRTRLDKYPNRSERRAGKRAAEDLVNSLMGAKNESS